MKSIRSILKSSIFTLVLIVTAAGFSLPGQARAQYANDLTIDVWLDRGDGGVYNRGDGVTVYFKTNADCFVTLYNIDTDGFIRVLFPSYPGEGNYAQGGKTYTIPAAQHEDFFVIDEPTGIGYIEGVASPRPFYLEGWPFYTQRGHEGHYADAAIERVSGDPFLAMEEINAKILPFGEDAVFSDDFALYYVEEVVSHPRYVCNDCHEPVYYHYDPYYYHCNHIDIVVFDYWWYNRWFYCDYWWVDYYYYYDYYYYAPPPPYLGRRYTRKYGYTLKTGGGYATKGYGDRGGVIRVNDFYRNKDNYRVDFKPIGVKNNPVVSYKLPREVNEPGYGTKNGIQKPGPVIDDGTGSRNIIKPSPPGQAGSDYNSGKKIQGRSPVQDGGRNVSEGRSVTGKAPQSDWSQPAETSPNQSGRDVNRSGSTIKDGRNGDVGNRSPVTRKAPVEETEGTRSTGRKEYILNGWDKGKSGDSKESSGISIIKSRPGKSSDRPSSGTSNISTSQPKQPSRSISRPSPSPTPSRSSGSVSRSSPTPSRSSGSVSRPSSTPSKSSGSVSRPSSGPSRSSGSVSKPSSGSSRSSAPRARSK